jgi:hypothetical protein
MPRRLKGSARGGLDLKLITASFDSGTSRPEPENTRPVLAATGERSPVPALFLDFHGIAKHAARVTEPTRRSEGAIAAVAGEKLTGTFYLTFAQPFVTQAFNHGFAAENCPLLLASRHPDRPASACC